MKKYINLPELNFILTFAGFALFTTFIQNSTASIAYRAFALLVSLICIFLYKPIKRLNRQNRLLVVFMALYVLMVIGCLWDLYVGHYRDTPYIGSRNMAALFIVGVTFFPAMAFYRSYNYIKWENVLHGLFWVLFFVLALGQIRGVTDDMSGRGSLNSHMSTLGLAEMGVYLTLVSASLVNIPNHTSSKKILKFIYVIGILLGLLSIGRAASRGPFIGVILSLAYFFLAGKKTTKTAVVLLAGVFIVVGASFNMILEKYAPVLYERMEYTLEEGDTGGRDVLYKEAIKTIKENPILGGASVMLEPNAFSNCHNMYLDTTVELGVIGGMVFIAISLYLLFWCLYNARNVSLVQLFFSSLFIFNIVRGMSGLSISTNPVVVIGYIGLIMCKFKTKSVVYKNSFVHYD